MQLDQCDMTLRERNVFEIYDLVIALVRKKWRSLALIYLSIGLPMGILSSLVLWYTDLQDSWYVPILLWCAQMPILAALCGSFLGHSMFDPGQGLMMQYVRLMKRFRLIIILIFVRLLLSLFPAKLMLYPVHIELVALLEQQQGSAMWRRARRLSSENAGFVTGSWALNTLLLGFLALILIGSFYVFAETLRIPVFSDDMTENAVWRLFGPGSVVVNLFMPGLIILACVQRFCAYIDIRTRREGWDTSVQLRRAAQDLERRHGRTEPKLAQELQS